MEEKVIEMQVTCGSLREAKKIAETLVSEKLAACANTHEVESFYLWKGKFEKHSEWIILFKTIESLYPAAEKRSKGLSAYELPAIFATKVEMVDEGFRKWVLDNVKKT
jgi:uncharacterized protein involved in tolerance to divalent cations